MDLSNRKNAIRVISILEELIEKPELIDFSGLTHDIDDELKSLVINATKDALRDVSDAIWQASNKAIETAKPVNKQNSQPQGNNAQNNAQAVVDALSTLVAGAMRKVNNNPTTVQDFSQNFEAPLNPQPSYDIMQQQVAVERNNPHLAGNIDIAKKPRGKPISPVLQALSSHAGIDLSSLSPSERARYIKDIEKNLKGK